MAVWVTKREARSLVGRRGRGATLSVAALEQAALEQHDWNLQPAADQLLALRESRGGPSFAAQPESPAAVSAAAGNGDSPVLLRAASRKLTGHQFRVPIDS